MKNLGKNILIVLVLGIALTSIISASEQSATINNTISETISNLESDIEAGLIIQDGNIENNDIFIETNNNIGHVTNKVGNFITTVIAKILEFFAKLFGSLLS